MMCPFVQAARTHTTRTHAHTYTHACTYTHARARALTRTNAHVPVSWQTSSTHRMYHRATLDPLSRGRGRSRGLEAAGRCQVRRWQPTNQHARAHARTHTHTNTHHMLTPTITYTQHTHTRTHTHTHTAHTHTHTLHTLRTHTLHTHARARALVRGARLSCARSLVNACMHHATSCKQGRARWWCQSAYRGTVGQCREVWTKRF
jgi:hypothetical protein